MIKSNSLGNRLIAFMLSIIMVLGMLPASAIAQEATAEAQIGNVTYETLADAIAAVPTGTNQVAPADATTIKLLRNTAYAFDVGTSTGATTMNLKLDLNGKTLTLSPSVGSVGTKANGIRVLAYSKLEIANGTLLCSSEASDNVKVGIANYGTLVLDSVSVKAGSLTQYTVNNRGALTLKGNTVITSGSVCAVTNDPYNLYYTSAVNASVTCESSDVAVESMLVERYERNSANNGIVELNISAGYFGKIVEDGSNAVGASYNVTGGVIGVSSTEELDLALNMINAGAEYSAPEKPVIIKLQNSIAGSFDVGISTGKAPKNICLDLNGNTMTLKPGVGSFNTETSGIRVLAYSKLEVKNGTLLCSSEAADRVKVGIANYGELVLDCVALKAGDQTIYTVNNRGALTLKGNTSVTAGSTTAITNDPYDLYYTSDVDASVTCDSSSVSVESILVERYERNSENKGGVKLNISAGFFGKIEEDGASSVGATYTITGGSFGSDISDFCSEEYKVVKDENGNYVVKSKQANFGFEKDEYKVTFGANGNKFAAIAENATGEVTYSFVTETDVAEINAKTGELTILKAGTVQVKAVAAGNAQYAGAEDTYTLVIEPAFAEVHSFSGGTVTGSGTADTVVYIDNAVLEWTAKDESIGRTQDGWWVGIKIVAPDGVDLSKAVYQRRSGGTYDGAEVTPFVPESDRYLGMWGLVTDAYLESFISAGKKMNYVWRFSWDGDDVYEQTIAITIDPAGITLKQSGFAFGIDEETITFGEDYSARVPSGGQADKITYSVENISVSDTPIAQIDPETGKLTIHKAGTVKITATLSGNSFEPISDSYVLTIEKADQTGFGFENAPSELTWQKDAIDALALINGKGEGKLTWSIIEGMDVATVSADGKITLLKAGSFTIQVQKAGDECYNASAVITATITVNKAAQSGFGFGETEKVSVTYNDNENKYTLLATGGQTAKDVVYSILSGDAATVDAASGVVTIVKAGTVVIQAVRPADDQYSEATDTYELVIEKDAQSFTFDHLKQIVEKYGLTSFATQITPSALNSGDVTYAVSGDAIGATVDEAGVVSFANSTGKVGTVTVTVTMVEDACYKPFTDTYTITLGYEAAPAVPYTLHGNKLISGSDWFTGDVTILAPDGYQISYNNDLIGTEWKNSVIWNKDGEKGAWAEGSEPVVYLKNSTTGAITDAIPVNNLKRDTVKPNGLAISYDVSVWETIGEKLFGFSATTVKVTASAADSLSGVGKVEYSKDGGKTYTEIIADNGEYKFDVESQYRGQLWIRVTDVAGNVSEYKHLKDNHETILIVDHTAPGLTVGYTGGMDDEATDGIRYVKSDKVTVVFEITDENFDLRAANPIVTVNGEEVSGWVVDATSGTLIFDLTDEGDYVIKAEFADRLNRKVSYESEVRVDRTKPAIESTIVDGKYYTENQTFVLTITEHNFDVTKVNLAISAVDSKGNAVLSDAEIQAFEDLAKNPGKWVHIEGTDKHQLTFEIAKDGNYTVKIDCSDNLAWAADTYTRTFAIDKVNPDQPTLKYEVGTAKSDLLIETILNKLFGFAKETTVVTVQSGDATSGIDRLEYKLHNDEYTKVNMDADGKYSFNLDPEYRGVITVVVYDKAGRSTTTVEQKEIVVDSIAPDVVIEFTGDRQDAVKADNGAITRESMSAPDATTRFIYNGNVTATIKVKEANFFKEIDMPITVIRDEQVVTTGFTDSGWSNEPNAEGYYIRTIILKDDGDYRIRASYRDHSLNDMEWGSNEYAQSGVYSYESNIHTIDTTAPVYEVTYDNNEITQTLNGREYFKADREATIKVTDRNFRPDEVVFSVIAKDIAGKDVAYTYSQLKSWNDWTKGADGITWTAKVPFAPDANYTVSFSYDDLANHKMVNKDQEEKVYSAEFTVDTKIPTGLKVEYKSKDAQILNKILSAITFGNYKAAQEVVLTMTDATAGIDYIQLTVTPEGPASATNLVMPENLVVNADGSVKSGTKGFIGTIRSSANNGDLTLSFDVPAQFRGKIGFTAYDKSGNHSNAHEDPGVLVVDTIAPGHTISYNPSNVVNVSGMKDMASFDVANGITDITSKDASYVMYFSGDAVAKIEIAEANFDPAEVILEVQDAAGNAVQGWTQTDWVTTTKTGEADVHTKTVTIAAEGDYRIKVYYQDHSMNTPVDYLSQWIVVDKTAPVINVQYSNTNVKNTIENRDYFSEAQTAIITIKEHNFRADDVVIKVTAKDVLDADVLTLNADGTVKAYADQGADGKNWTSYETGTWRVKDDAFILTLEFDTDANYTFDIAYRDLAKNAAADYEQDLFTVDQTAPENLTVAYSTSVLEQIKESVTFGYYNAMMTVTITAEDDTSGIYHFAYSYIKGKDVSGVNAELLNQAIEKAKITYKGKQATATFDIPKMVLGADNQFNGTVAFTAFDRSEKSAELKDETIIIVDNITPTAKITYNAPIQTANGISYFDGNINASVVINEANFDANDVVVTVTKNGANFPVNVSWKDNSVDTHTGTFTLTEDGDYVVSVQYKDKSGNEMAAYKSNQLTLDTAKPTINVSNIKVNSANKDEKYSFVITVDDTNLDAASIKPVLKAVVQKEEGIYVIEEIDLGSAKTVVAGKTYTYTVEDLPKDGLYTLSCSVKDMSANGMAQVVLEDGKSYDQVQFSINRQGSAFGYGNKFTEELVGQYYIYSVNEDVVIVEVNVDPIEEYKVSLNGKELVEGTDYTTVQTSKDGEWSKRTYTIKKALFEAEGEYSIIVSSTDKADTTAFSDVKNLSLAFVVDQTKPALTITGLEAGGRYQTDEQIVTLIPTDEGGRLNSLAVLVLDSDGNPLKDDNGADISVRFNLSGEELLKHLEDNDGKITFTIPEGLNNQVKIVCNDCAVNAEDLTNEYNELFERVTVSQNQFVIFYANTPLFVGTIAGVLAIAGLIVFLIKRKKNKKNKAAAKA